jgi:hypothetical protein
MLRTVIVIVVIAITCVLTAVNEALSSGAIGLFFATSAVIIWKTAKLRWVTTGSALAGLCCFGICALRVYGERSWLSMVLCLFMLTVLFGSMAIEKRLHPQAMEMWKRSGRGSARCAGSQNDAIPKP